MIFMFVSTDFKSPSSFKTVADLGCSSCESQGMHSIISAHLFPIQINFHAQCWHENLLDKQ